MKYEEQCNDCTNSMEHCLLENLVFYWLVKKLATIFEKSRAIAVFT
jgi:hypothetical protein